jgi:hypothetical protein
MPEQTKEKPSTEEQIKETDPKHSEEEERINEQIKRIRSVHRWD